MGRDDDADALGLNEERVGWVSGSSERMKKRKTYDFGRTKCFSAGGAGLSFLAAAGALVVVAAAAAAAANGATEGLAVRGSYVRTRKYETSYEQRDETACWFLRALAAWWLLLLVAGHAAGRAAEAKAAVRQPAALDNKRVSGFSPLCFRYLCCQRWWPLFFHNGCSRSDGCSSSSSSSSRGCYCCWLGWDDRRLGWLGRGATHDVRCKKKKFFFLHNTVPPARFQGPF